MTMFSPELIDSVEQLKERPDLTRGQRAQVGKLSIALATYNFSGNAQILIRVRTITAGLRIGQHLHEEVLANLGAQVGVPSLPKRPRLT